VLIDWFTVGAQIVNFLILIYLLKRFLYKPILRAMEEREKKISDRLQEAAENREKAETEAKALAAERQELENKKEQLQVEAKEEIRKWRDEAMEKAKEEAEKVRHSWQESVEKEKEDFVRKMKITLGRQIFKVASKALQDLADDRLEVKLVEKFKEKMHEAVGEKEEARQNMGGELEIRSGFEIGEDQQKDLGSVVEELFPEAAISFKTDPGYGFGIRLIGSSRKIEWGLDRYMEDMEKNILDTMQLRKGEKK
jgi:F-type H+-transporting ATPase subunit b